MQTIHIASAEGVNVEQSPGKLISVSRPMNIASVRATSLRDSGLRAASSRRGIDVLKEKQSLIAALGAETRMSANELGCFSSSVSMTSSTHLSYTNSQEPGEDSQLNALAMVDKLVNWNASLMWQKPESGTVAEHSCVQGPQSNKGIQSLARNAGMKTLQEKTNIFNWIDSQPDENGDLERVSPTFKGQQPQPGVNMPTENRKVCQGKLFDLAGTNDTSNGIIFAEEPSLVKRQNDERDAEMMDIGANTQIALEAMDIMRCGIQLNHGSAPHNEKALFALSDIGSDAQTSMDVIDVPSNNQSAFHKEKAVSSLLDMGNDTQSAIDAIDIMRHDVREDIVLSKVKETASLVDIGNDTQTALDAIDIMRHGIEADIVPPKAKTPNLFDIGSDTQTAIEAIDIMRHGIERDAVILKVERREEIEQGSRVRDLKAHASRHDLHAKRNLTPRPSTVGRKGGLLSKAASVTKLVAKKGSSREMSKTLKSLTSAVLNLPAEPIYESNKRFLLDFSSAMVPRRKRSRLCAPRGALNENFEVFECHQQVSQPHKPLTKSDRQAQSGKHTSFESRKSALGAEQDGHNPDVAVLNESINGELVRRTKQGIATKLDCYTLLEQSRKRRKCEPGCIFVLFSHSLSEATIKEQKKMLMKLGGHVVTLAAKATHFVADSFARSRNMLEIMAAGKVVVTTMWLEGCSQAEYFVDENSYILQDTQKEKQWGFCMHSSLAASRRKPLFKGMKVVVSPSTAPDYKAVKAMIECAGGQALPKLSSSLQSKGDEIASLSFVVGSEEDYDFCAEFLKKGCKVYSTELILHGIVTQNLDFSRNCLFEDYLP